MNWFYAEGQKQHGPVTEEELRDLQRNGEVNATTLVWCDGMESWQPLSEARPLAPAQEGEAVCSECGGRFLESELVPFEKKRVCARCKPLFLQRLREGVSDAGGVVWRDGRRLVTVAGQALPGRCVKCNAPTDGTPIRRNLYWHQPWLYVLILLSIWIYIIVALIVRKRAKVDIFLCGRHQSRRIAMITAAWVICLASIVGCVVALGVNQGWLALLAVLLVLGGLCLGNFGGRAVYATRIEATRVWLGGVCEAFLQDLPPWRGGA